MSGSYQRKDHLYREAKKKGYRSRASFKLEELDKKHRLFKRGIKVIDLGCSPGGWAQVAASKVGAQGLVIGVDLEPLLPLSPEEVGGSAARVEFIQGDIQDESVRARIVELSGGLVGGVISDMSPNISGVSFRDAVRSAELVEIALELGTKLLSKGGFLVAKIFPGEEEGELFKKYRKRFSQFLRVYLDATRKTSKELYFVGKDFVE